MSSVSSAEPLTRVKLTHQVFCGVWRVTMPASLVSALAALTRAWTALAVGQPVAQLEALIVGIVRYRADLVGRDGLAAPRQDDVVSHCVGAS